MRDCWLDFALRLTLPPLTLASAPSLFLSRPLAQHLLHATYLCTLHSPKYAALSTVATPLPCHNSDPSFTERPSQQQQSQAQRHVRRLQPPCRSSRAIDAVAERARFVMVARRRATVSGGLSRTEGQPANESEHRSEQSIHSSACQQQQTVAC